MTLSKVDKAMSQAPRSINRFVRSLCGEQLGVGLSRDVYVFEPDPRYVAKIERDNSQGDFANVCEWRNYINLRDWSQFARWLAPCVAIRESGQVLIQRRVRFRAPELYPTHVPSLLTDLKYANYGWLGKRFVCCDYAFLIIGTPYRMKRARWWGDDPRGQ